MGDTAVTIQTTLDNSIARAKDSDKTQWSDAQLLIFLNKAVDYVHKLLIRIENELVITDGTITMAASTQEYTLAGTLDDFWAMSTNGVYFTDFLTPCSYEDKIREGSTTTDVAPTLYYVTDTHLGVVNIPTATSAAAYPTLNCRYFKKNTALALTDNMPYKNLFNEPVSSFVDHVAVLKTTAPTQEFTALYNALEASTLEIAKKRSPL